MNKKILLLGCAALGMLSSVANAKVEFYVGLRASTRCEINKFNDKSYDTPWTFGYSNGAGMKYAGVAIAEGNHMFSDNLLVLVDRDRSADNGLTDKPFIGSFGGQVGVDYRLNSGLFFGVVGSIEYDFLKRDSLYDIRPDYVWNQVNFRKAKSEVKGDHGQQYRYNVNRELSLGLGARVGYKFFGNQSVYLTAGAWFRKLDRTITPLLWIKDAGTHSSMNWAVAGVGNSFEHVMSQSYANDDTLFMSPTEALCALAIKAYFASWNAMAGGFDSTLVEMFAQDTNLTTQTVYKNPGANGNGYGLLGVMDVVGEFMKVGDGLNPNVMGDNNDIVLENKEWIVMPSTSLGYCIDITKNVNIGIEYGVGYRNKVRSFQGNQSVKGLTKELFKKWTTENMGKLSRWLDVGKAKTSELDTVTMKLKSYLLTTAGAQNSGDQGFLREGVLDPVEFKRVMENFIGYYNSKGLSFNWTDYKFNYDIQQSTKWEHKASVYINFHF